MRVDRFLSNLPRFNRKQVRLLLVARRIRVDGVAVSDPHHEVREFSRVCLDDEVLQAGKPARYFMLHKPRGCVSATSDPEHPTVLGHLLDAMHSLSTSTGYACVPKLAPTDRSYLPLFSKYGVKILTPKNLLRELK